MKRLVMILLASVVSAVAMVNASAQDSGYFLMKSNLNVNLGFDVGIGINDVIGAKAGMIADIYRPDSKTGSFEESLGRKYRLSYTAGPYFRITDCFAVSASVGYGEIGTYGYNSQTDQYGIAGKIKGLELGLQLQFMLDGMIFELGYGTLPVSFGLGRPFTDISFGVGTTF